MLEGQPPPFTLSPSHHTARLKTDHLTFQNPSISQVADLRRVITSKLDIEDRKLAVVEVARNKVHRTLEERMLLRFLNTTTRWVLTAAINIG